MLMIQPFRYRCPWIGNHEITGLFASADTIELLWASTDHRSGFINHLWHGRTATGTFAFRNESSARMVFSAVLVVLAPRLFVFCWCVCRKELKVEWLLGLLCFVGTAWGLLLYTSLGSFTSNRTLIYKLLICQWEWSGGFGLKFIYFATA